MIRLCGRGENIMKKQVELHLLPFISDIVDSAFANESYLITSQSADEGPELVKEYKAHFGAGCSKALSCQTVCPVGIETLTSILKMNRK